jgi:AbrB family looped-hinge helix DNA binding protein
MVAVPAQTARKKWRARIGPDGQLVIPEDIRQELGLNEGELVVMQIADGELRIISVHEGIRRAQEIARKYIVPGKSIVDELIAERRAEAAREEAEAREAEGLRE